MIDLIAVWVMCAGVWPFADPGHEMNTVASVLDVALHVAAVGVLAWRWKVVRRRPQYVITWTTRAGTSTVTTTSEQLAEDLFRQVSDDDPSATITRRRA